MNLAIQTRALARSFGDRQAVKDLTIEVPRGSIFGFLGPNGAGKTTTIRLLLGLIEPSSGSGLVLGNDIATAGAAIREASGALLEHTGLYDRLSAYDNLAFYARVYGLDGARREQRITELLEAAGLRDRRNDRVRGWSRGMRQKLAIARTLLHQPQLVFLDEPTAGLDVIAAIELRQQIKSLAREGKTTVFLTTHNMQEAEELCDRIAVILEGRVLAAGTPRELRGSNERTLEQVFIEVVKGDRNA